MNRGYAVILTGYVGWGLFPLYWALLAHVASFEVLLHRILWSLPALAVLVLASGRRRRQVRAALAAWTELRWLALSGVLLSFNWGLYIWAIANAQVLEASMGYFLTPLLNVLAGVLVFRERIGRIRLLAVGFAVAGVGYYLVGVGSLPFVALGVGVSFATYGLLRKRMATNAIPGLFVETLLLLPLTLAAIAWLHWTGDASFAQRDRWTDLWLVLGGPVSVFPLAFFTAGSRMLPMTSVGILFYVTPSMQFVCGLLLGEPLDFDKLIAFAGIWIGLGLFTWSLIRQPAAVAAPR